jgi:hypothetical protein
MKLDDASDAFHDKRDNKSAAQYLRALIDYHADDMIGDDTFLNGLADIETFLDPKD